MKLLLTAAGLRNESLRQALRDMLGEPFGSARFVHIPTASNVMPGDRRWLVDELAMVHGLGWREFDVLELNGPTREMVIDRLLHADVIYGGGGNRFHRARSITGNGLADGFRQARENRVYVGISGGSMIFSRALDERSADIFEDDNLRVPGATTVQPPFGFLDWYLQPHLYSSAFPNWGDAWADRIAARGLSDLLHRR